MAEALSAKKFIAEVERLVKPGEGQKLTTAASDQYVRLALIAGSKRYQLTVSGFDPKDHDAPAPGANIGNRGGPGIVEAEANKSSDLKMRKKSGTTQVIAKYVADALNEAGKGAADTRLASSVVFRYLKRA